jgi:transposase
MAIGMVRRTGGGGSCDGVHGAILETGVGNPRTLLAAELQEAGRCAPCQERCIWRWRSPIAERRGRKRDFPDAERLLKRLVTNELTLSFVPDTEQRLWRTVTRRRYQRTCDKVRSQNQLEALLEEAHLKLSSLVSDLLGVSARRMLQALPEGETNAAALAALADKKLRTTPEQLCDALGACTDLNLVYRRLLKMVLEELQGIEQQIGQLDQEMPSLLRPYQDAVQRLAEVPGFGVNSAQQILAEIGPPPAPRATAICGGFSIGKRWQQGAPEKSIRAVSFAPISTV